MGLKIHVEKQTTTKQIPKQNQPDEPKKNPKRCQNKSQTEQDSKMLSVSEQQNVNAGTGPEVLNSELCFLCCVNLLLKYVFVGLWSVGVFFGRLIRSYLVFLYGSSCIDRWLLKIPRIEHLVIQKSLVPAAGLFWLLCGALGHVWSWPVGAARALVGRVAGCAVCIIYNTLCSLLPSLSVALGCAGGKGWCIHCSFPSLGASSRSSPQKRFGQNDCGNTLQSSHFLRSAWGGGAILQSYRRTEISCLRSEP